ncbi:MAG: hypothetical protein OEW77_03530 [Gemmatimonadota bacterium]|nr:hypothetical protein [Gemmatimonadota bacterium]
MDKTQKQVTDSYTRVRAFLDAHPATERLTQASSREVLDDGQRRSLDSLPSGAPASNFGARTAP